MILNYFNEKYIREVYTNHISKSKSKGIDKKNHLYFESIIESEIAIILKKVTNNSYTFSPYLEILKSKGRKKHPRIISIPTIRDRIVLYILKEILHQYFSFCINKKLPNSYIRDIKKYLSNSTNVHFIKLDIKNFYGSINRNILTQKLIENSTLDNRIINLIIKAINNVTIPSNTNRDKYKEYLETSGIPQGLSISNILAQIYLYNLDMVIDKRKYFYRRYVDDIIILNDNIISNFRHNNLKKALSDIHLEFNEEKTQKGTLEDEFNFLGYSISNKKITVSDIKVEKFIQKIAGKITWFKNGINNPIVRPNWLKNDNRFKEVFIEELNDIITGIISDNKQYGWLFYYSEITDESLLFRIDKIITRFFYKLRSFDYNFKEVI